MKRALLRPTPLLIVALAAMGVACGRSPTDEVEDEEASGAGEDAAMTTNDEAGARGASAGGAQSFREAILGIAARIEALRTEYPQLADFSSSRHCDADGLKISYGYRTHRAERRGGWTAGVPNPDDDGVWFHVDIHEADSQAQIHTQPVVEPLFYRDRKVMFLILEGAQTRKLSGALRSIMLDCGVRAGTR